MLIVIAPCNRRSANVPLSVGLTQTTFNNGRDDDDDDCDSCNGSTGVVVGRDLFIMATFENIETEAEVMVLNATMNEAEEELEAAWHRFKSHYWKLGWEEREEHKASFDNLVSTMGAPKNCLRPWDIWADVSSGGK